MAGTLAAASADIQYRVRMLPWLPNRLPPNNPKAINDLRQVAGFSWTYDAFGRVVLIGFRLDLDSEAYIVLDMVPGDPTVPLAIANSGAVVGENATPQCGDSWIWTASAGMTVLGDLPGGSCSARADALNNLDQAVGISRSANGAEAFLWTRQNGMIGLGDLPGGCFFSHANDINDNTWVVGNGCVPGFLGAGFLWTPDSGMMAMDDLIEGDVTGTSAQRINNNNQVVGMYTSIDTPGRYRLYLWSPGEPIQALPWLTEDATETQGVFALSDRTHVLGEAVTAGEFEYIHTPFIWDQRRGMRSVASLLDPCRPAHQILGFVMDINADGWILAQVAIQNPNTEHPHAVLVPYIPGDLDNNEVCDLQDLAIQLSNFARAGDATYASGDLDCDRDVDLEDLAILLGNFGETLP